MERPNINTDSNTNNSNPPAEDDARFQIEAGEESMNQSDGQLGNNNNNNINNSNVNNNYNMSAAIMELGETLNTFSVSSQNERRPLEDTNSSNNTNNQQQYFSYNRNDSMDSSSDLSNINDQLLLQDEDMATEMQQDIYDGQQQQQHQRERQEEEQSDILIVTNVDENIFTNDQLKSKFESLFLAYDQDVKFRYLKSFRRVRLDFSSSETAEMARINLSHYKLGDSEFRCFPAKLIRAFRREREEDEGRIGDPMHLRLPKLTKQFLLSPPVSPPNGWVHIEEAEPNCFDVQLISAIANLVPGKTHELHAGNESQPGIFVEVCEDHPQLTTGPRKTCHRQIPKTASPVVINQY